jgi:hypothetical protein
MSQRAIRISDIELAELIGTEVEGGPLVREKDFQDFERRVKKLVDQARRLIGKRVVRGEGGVLVTAYHAGRHKQRRLLHRKKRRLHRGADRRWRNRERGLRSTLRASDAARLEAQDPVTPVDTLADEESE